MKVICLIILVLILVSVVSASSSERITVSVFVKESPKNNNSTINHLNFLYDNYNYKVLINAIANLMNKQIK